MVVGVHPGLQSSVCVNLRGLRASVGAERHLKCEESWEMQPSLKIYSDFRRSTRVVGFPLCVCSNPDDDSRFRRWALTHF